MCRGGLLPPPIPTFLPAFRFPSSSPKFLTHTSICRLRFTTFPFPHISPPDVGLFLSFSPFSLPPTPESLPTKVTVLRAFVFAVYVQLPHSLHFYFNGFGLLTNPLAGLGWRSVCIAVCGLGWGPAAYSVCAPILCPSFCTPTCSTCGHDYFVSFFVFCFSLSLTLNLLAVVMIFYSAVCVCFFSLSTDLFSF